VASLPQVDTASTRHQTVCTQSHSHRWLCSKGCLHKGTHCCCSSCCHHTVHNQVPPRARSCHEACLNHQAGTGSRTGPGGCIQTQQGRWHSPTPHPRKGYSQHSPVNPLLHTYPRAGAPWYWRLKQLVVAPLPPLLLLPQQGCSPCYGTARTSGVTGCRCNPRGTGP
jgi:hypothetical protein